MQIFDHFQFSIGWIMDLEFTIIEGHLHISF